MLTDVYRGYTQSLLEISRLVRLLSYTTAAPFQILSKLLFLNHPTNPSYWQPFPTIRQPK